MASRPNPRARSRFSKLGMALNEELTQACRDVLDMEVPPGLVHNKVKASSIYKKIRPEQERRLIGAKTNGYKEFDISLLYTLIRNICTKIPRPTKGWGGSTMPSVGEIRIGDDIERIRMIRNEMFAHSASTSKTDFDNTWSVITDICQRLQTYTNKDYISGLSNIQRQAFEEETENAVIGKLEEQFKNNQSLMEKVSSAEEHVVEKVSCVEEHVIKKVSSVEEHVVENVSSVGERVIETLFSFEQHVLERISKSDKQDTSLEKDILESWRKEDSNFVPTAASEYVEEKIKSQNLVTVVGNSGCGKTAIIQHIALNLKDEKGWDIRPVDEVKEIKHLCSLEILQDKTILFLLNDPIGKESLDDISYNSWKTYEKTLEICLKKVKLLVSCRRCVINDKRLEGILKKKSNAVEIDSDKWKLSTEEKKKILDKYCHQMHLSKKIIREIVKTEAYFPLLCKLFSNESTNKENEISLFKHPFKIIKKDIERLKELDKRKYCGLILIAVFDNNLNVETISRTEHSLKKYRIILGICELSENTNISIIRNALLQIEGSYVKCVGHTFQFLHDFIMEITTLVFGVDCPQETLQYADSGFLRRRVRIEDDTEEEDRDPFTVYLPEEYIDDLVDRFIIDMQTEHLVDVLLNPCLRKESVIESLKEKIDKKHWKILVEIKCEIDRSEFSNSFEGSGLSRLLFLDWKDKTCPLIGFIIFCHDDISSFFLEKINESRLKDYPFFSAICANGKSYLLKSLSREYKISALLESWNNFLPIHVASVFHNFSILEELVRLGADVNKFTIDDMWTPLTLASINDEEHLKEAGNDTKEEERRNKTIMCLLNNGAMINLCNKNRASPLLFACEHGLNSTVQLLLNNDADINLCEKSGASPLYIACQNGHYSTVQLLLNNDAKINLCSKNGASPLFIACEHGHKSTANLLLNNGADINLCDKNAGSPLYIACQNGHESTVQLLLNNDADINLWYKNEFGPLYIACEKGHESTVQMLLNKDANINLCDNDGHSPLHIACQNGHDSTVQLLLNNGADIHLCAINGASPLSIACQTGHYRTAQLLLKNGADINLCSKNGASPLFKACEHGHKSTVNLLMNKSADINLCDKNIASPLYIACQNGHESTVQLLLNNRADINLCNKNGASPLYIACEMGHDSTVQLLLNNRAEINLCNKNGFSPLHKACFKKEESTAQLLLNNGADISLCDINGFSPLHLACFKGHDKTVQLLLNYGANVNLCNNNGVSPLYKACQNGYDSTVQLLLNNGADINLCDKNGASPLDIACQKGHDSTVQLLLKKQEDIN